MVKCPSLFCAATLTYSSWESGDCLVFIAFFSKVVVLDKLIVFGFINNWSLFHWITDTKLGQALLSGFVTSFRRTRIQPRVSFSVWLLLKNQAYWKRYFYFKALTMDLTGTVNMNWVCIKQPNPAHSTEQTFGVQQWPERENTALTTSSLQRVSTIQVLLFPW